jgi:Helix-turn-helix domain
MASENADKATSHQSEPSTTQPGTQEPPRASDSSQVLACLLILPSDAKPIVSLLKDLATALPCTSPLPFVGGPVSAKVIDGPWLKHADAAGYLGISKSTLCQYVCQQKIECRKLAGRLEYRRSTLDQFKDHQTRPAHRWFSKRSLPPDCDGAAPPR